MRVLLGLAALAAVSGVSAQTVTTSGNAQGSIAVVPGAGQTALAIIDVKQQLNGVLGAPLSVNPTLPNTFAPTLPYVVYVNYQVSTLVFTFTTNTLTGQMQYRWSPNYSFGMAYTCDPCAGGTTTSCNTANGPATGTNGSPCSSLTRTYTFSNLVMSSLTLQIVNAFSVQLFDRNPLPNTSSYSFSVYRNPSPIIGDPQIIGIQGQDFQVHGTPDEIFNMITTPNLQVNARFVYLSSAECHDNYTACFAHPGTYISEEGFRVGKDKLHIVAGSFKKGLTVKLNGQRLVKSAQLKSGSVELVNHRRVVVKTPLMAVQVTNSDHFLNQETELYDAKLIEAGKLRRKLLVGESFKSEVPVHGLQGQTWRNVEYPSGLDYEGSIADYQIADGNLFGTQFVFNKFQI